MKIRIAVLLVILFATLCWAAHAEAPLSKPTSVDALFKLAIELGGYKDKCAARYDQCPVPRVLIAPFEDDNIAGQFNPWDSGSVIRVTSDERFMPGSLEFNAVMIHEMVHYLQFLTGKFGPHRADICDMMLEAETEAYNAGAAYFARYGIVKDYASQRSMLAMNHAMCKAAGY